MGGSQDRVEAAAGPGSRQALLVYGLVAAAHGAGLWLAYTINRVTSEGVPLFPAAGVSAAALLLSRRDRWPGILAATFLAELIGDLIIGAKVDTARFTVRPVAPVIGAVIEGISLADEVDEELLAELNRALLEWKVLFFRDQRITHEQHLAFASHWGPLESHPFISLRADQPDDKPEVVRLEKGPEMGGYENVWHSDVTWREIPSLGSILRAVEVPEVGGDTLWADMGAAYDGLTDEVKGRIEGLSAVHDWIRTFGAFMAPERRDALRVDFPAVEHPIVRSHPETGRKTLFVNRAFTQHVVGMEKDESNELLAFLYAQAAVPEYQCRFRWAPGDIAFWDNRATQHYASSDYFPQRRVMERITVIGDRPY